MGRPRKLFSNIVDTKQLSDLLRLTEKRCQQLRQKGVFPEVPDNLGRPVEGQWNLGDCLHAYIVFKTRDVKKSVANEDLEKSKARKMSAQADQEEVRRDLMLGRVIRCVDAERTWGDFASACRGKLLSMPTKLARVLLGQKDIVFIATTIEDCVKEALTELKDFDVEDIQRNNTELMLVDAPSDENEASVDVDDTEDDSEGSLDTGSSS